jgi:hypothetical protein
MEEEPDEVVVRANDLRDLFSTQEYDPLTRAPDALWSIAQVAALSEAAADLSKMTLRVVLPQGQMVSDTAAVVGTAVQRYCAYNVAMARARFVAWRRVVWWTCLIGLAFFALSLIATAGIGRLAFLPEELRTITTETLVIAGWIVMWQPLDDLIQGWWPIREQERKYKAIGAMRLVVEGAG